MASMIKIAVDAMGGDNSPEKINGIIITLTKQRCIYKIFGDEQKLLVF